MPRRILGQDFAPTTARTIQEVGTEVGKQQNFLRTGLDFAERTGEGITQSALAGVQATRELANTAATIAAQNQQRLAQGGGVGGILGGLSDLLEGYTDFERARIETALKRQKTQGKRELVFATQEMQALLSDGDEMMPQQGAKNLEAQGLKVIGKYPNISPTDIVPLTKDLYSKIETYRKAQSKKRADNIEAAAKFKQEVRIADINNRASGILQQIQDNPNLFVDKLRELDNLFKTVQEENPDLGVHQVAEIEAELYTEFLGRVQQGTDAHNAMVAKRNNLNRFALGFAQIQQNPEMGPLEKTVAINNLALETGVTEAYKKAVINVPSLIEQQTEALKLQNEYDAAKRTAYEQQQANAELDEALQIQVAYAYALDPISVETTINSSPLKNNVNYQIGLRSGQAIIDYYELKAQTDVKVNQIEQQMLVYEQRMNAFIGGQGTKADLTAIQELSRIMRGDGLNARQSTQINNEIQEKPTDALFGTDQAERLKAQEEWRLLKKQVIATYKDAITQYKSQLESAKRGLEKYKLPPKLDEFRYQLATQDVLNKLDQGRKVMDSVPREQGVGTGTSINFNNGDVNKFVIMRSPRNGQNMVLPFAAGTKNLRVSGQHGDPRSHGPHAGLDIAADMGTPLISPVKGKVVQVRSVATAPRMGNYIDIRDDATGAVYRYGHLQEVPPLKAGDVIGVGDPVGKVGNTGVGTGPHLHMEIRRTGDPVNHKGYYGHAGATDPEAWLTQLYRNSQRKSDQPPGDNLELLRKDLGLETDTNTSQDHVVGATDLVMPGIGNLKDNKIVQGMSLKQAREIINEATPYIHKLAPYDKNGWGTSDNTGSYGHAYMERNTDFRDKLNSLANELEIPGYWLADVIAYENGFNHKQSDLGADFFGIANLSMHQITELAEADFQDYINGTPTEQLAVVGDYIKYNVDKYGAINNLGDLTAMFFAGEWGYREYKEKGVDAFGTGRDGNNMTFQTYLEKIGAGTKRKYKIPGRNANLSFMSPIHTEYHEQCSICRAMRNSDSEIVPHHGLIA